MANTTTIILKNSGTAGNIPSNSNLEYGEIALNYVDGILFYKHGPTGQVLSISGGSVAANIANSAYDQANVARTHANGAFLTANVAYDTANTKLNISGGIITGDLSVTGNLIVSGSYEYVNVQTYQVADPLIYLASNNYTSDLVDIGFVANYVNATGSNVHTGLVRDSTSKEYYLFHGYDKEPINNHLDPNANNFTLSFVNANLRSSNIILNGLNLSNWITSSYDQANTARTHANGAFNQANVTAEIANAAYDKANTANITADAAFARANAANLVANLAFDKANTANVIASAAFTKANQQTNLAFSIVIANGTSLTADSNADTLTILTTGNVAITADATGDNMTFDLTTTGVIAGVYGNSTIVPVITVDARGRLTSVTNTAIAGAAADTLQSVTNNGNTTANIVIITNSSNSVSNATGALRVTGGVGVTGNIYVGSSSVIGYSNANSISVVYQYYNSVTNSLDTVFG